MSTDSRPLPGWISGGAVIAALITLVVAERLVPLRPFKERQFRHDGRNLAIAACGAIALRVAERPVVGALSRLVVRRRLGLLPQLRLGPTAATVCGILLLDYTLYLWHVATHKVPFLWRFHRVHHIDQDLTATTAVRFHFGELVLSVPWRAAQVLLLGIDPRTLSLWQLLLMLSILFHHSDTRLPLRLEARLLGLIVTPRMHGIHHSRVIGETNSNWSSGLTIWDRLHGTLQLGIPQQEIRIGSPDWDAELPLEGALVLPFRASSAGN